MRAAGRRDNPPLDGATAGHSCGDDREKRVSEDHKAELDRHFAWFETKLPPRGAHFVGWLRKPTSRYVRFPLALLLVAGGIFSFLPILGLWMLPLGLVLIAQDVPPLQKPTAQGLGWIERKWMDRQRAKAAAVGPALREQRVIQRADHTPPPRPEQKNPG
jgi:hypothetical protein